MTKIDELSEVKNRAIEARVTDETKDFLQSVQGLLKSKGFVRTDARNQSAMFHWEFTCGERVIVLTGWHGTGKRGTNRWFGDLKALLSVFDNKAFLGTDVAKWKRDEIFRLDVLDGTVADHTKLLKDTIDYIRKV